MHVSVNSCVTLPFEKLDRLMCKRFSNFLDGGLFQPRLLQKIEHPQKEHSLTTSFKVYMVKCITFDQVGKSNFALLI